MQPESDTGKKLNLSYDTINHIFFLQMISEILAAVLIVGYGILGLIAYFLCKLSKYVCNSCNRNRVSDTNETVKDQVNVI